MTDKPKVLLVDDEDALRMGLRRILEMEGFDVTEADCGLEGIRIGKSTNFDLAVLDLKMPDVDGITVLKAIHEKFPDTVCFMATAYASYETAITAVKSGAYGYILKPFTDEEMLHQLSLGLERRRLILQAEQLKAERERNLMDLAFERSRLNTVINILADGVLVVNKEEEIVYYNPAALKYLMLQGIKISDVITDKLPPDAAALLTSFTRAAAPVLTASSQQIEMLPNRELFIEFTCSPVLQADGSLSGVVIVVKNITSFKEIEHVKSQFVSMVSHELKAPVAATVGFLNLLLDTKVALTDEKRHDFLTRSVYRLQSLLTLVNDLLDISRMELKTVVRELKPIDVREIVKESLSIFQLEAEKKPVVVDVIYPEALAEFVADKGEIQRLFTNLISNGIKYNKIGGTLCIRFSESADYIKTTISDTGIGLKPEEKVRLFTEFYRAKNEMTKNIHGTGLGLSIVKRIVDSYNGTIEIESEYGKGTSFTIAFPVKK